MGKASNITVKENIEELEKWLKKTKYSKFENRVKVLLYLKKEEFSSQQAIANHIGIDISTVQRWLRKYRVSGIKELCKLETRNKPSKFITPEILNWLNSILTDSSAPAKGYKHLQVMIAEKFDIEIKYQTLYYYVRKYFKTKLKTPRKSHINKDEQAVNAFLKTT